jgi:hypothetical protein
MVLPGTESRSKSNVMLPDGRTDIPLAFVEIFLPLLNSEWMPGRIRLSLSEP